MDDDPEFEVTDLRLAINAEGADTERRRPAARGRLALGRAAHGPALFRPRLTPRQRMRGVVATSVVVLVVLAALLAGIPHASDVVAGLLPQAPAARPGSTVVFAVRGVPWGSLTLDGRTATYTSRGQPLSLQLPRGHHTLRYVAPPFADLTCALSVPPAVSDTCPQLYATPSTAGISPGAVRTIDLSATPERLPPAAYAALLAAVGDRLNAADATTVVPAGDRYLAAGASDMPVRAATPLQAQLYYTLNADTSIAVPVGYGATCVTLCDDPFGMQVPLDTPTWIIGANARVSWRYTAPGGATANLPAMPAGGPAGSDHVLLDLAVRWQRGWQVTPLPNGRGQDLCSLASAWIYSQRSLQPTTTYSTTGSSHAAQNPLAGCLVTIQFEANNNPVGYAGHFLYRFGLILAANDTAHRMDPLLPVATASEAAFAGEIAGS